jgi:hypothetical protein
MAEKYGVATPESSMSHVAIQEALEGTNVIWMEHVTDTNTSRARRVRTTDTDRRQISAALECAPRDPRIRGDCGPGAVSRGTSDRTTGAATRLDDSEDFACGSAPSLPRGWSSRHHQG